MRTVGEIQYNPKGQSWLISCEPHVTIRLKRVFGKISKHSQGIHALTDTMENARDLEWFLQRYPMKMQDGDAELLRFRSLAHIEQQGIIQRLMQEQAEPIDFPLAIPAREYQRLAATLTLETGRLLLADDVGTGKAQPNESLVLTPNGWRRIDELVVGDKVIDPDGGVGIVEGVFPQGVKDIYRVTTQDGASAECCEEHLWLLQTPNDRRRNGSRVLELRQFKDHLKESRYGKPYCRHFFLPLSKPVQFDCGDALPIHPYLLGAIIGDGTIGKNSVQFSTSDGELLERIESLLPPNMAILKNRHNKYDYRLSCLKKNQNPRNILVYEIQKLGLSNKKSWEKFIPDIYLYSSTENRLAFLRGLMDTDGTAETKGQTVFSTTSELLSRQVRELVCSLGGFGSITSRITKYTHNGELRKGRVSYNVFIRIPENPFSLTRKATLWHQPSLARGIESVDYVGSKEARCIKVSTKRNLYITDGYLVTHNTLSGICCFVQSHTRPALVVTLTHLPKQWKGEIEKFAPGMRVHIIKKGQPYDFCRERGKKVGFPDVIITSYSKLAGWGESLAPLCRTVVFDEVQELRRSESAKYAAAKFIADHCKVKLGLSATPIYNYGDEFFNVLNVLAPGALGNYHEFTREWCTFNGQHPVIKSPKAFGAYLREQGLMLRRTRADVGRELPGLTKIPHVIDADLQELNKLSSSCAELARLILRQGQEKRGEKMLASEEFTNTLRQATGIAKAPFVAEFVRLLVESGERVVLYGWHREVYKIWLDRLKDLNPVMYTGSESPAQKDAAKEKFLKGDSKVMIISLRAGAGLDGLQSVSRTVVFGELDWSPGVHEQNIGRIYRDGQEDKVVAYFLIAEAGADPIMAEVLGLKLMQSEPVRNPQLELVEELSRDVDHVKRLAESYLQQIGG